MIWDVIFQEAAIRGDEKLNRQLIALFKLFKYTISKPIFKDAFNYLLNYFDNLIQNHGFKFDVDKLVQTAIILNNYEAFKRLINYYQDDNKKQIAIQALESQQAKVKKHNENQAIKFKEMEGPLAIQNLEVSILQRIIDQIGEYRFTHEDIKKLISVNVDSDDTLSADKKFSIFRMMMQDQMTESQENYDNYFSSSVISDPKIAKYLYNGNKVSPHVLEQYQWYIDNFSKEEN